MSVTQNPSFGIGIVKAIQGITLSENENEALMVFKTVGQSGQRTIESSAEYAESILAAKRQK